MSNRIANTNQPVNQARYGKNYDNIFNPTRVKETPDVDSKRTNTDKLDTECNGGCDRPCKGGKKAKPTVAHD